MTFVIKKVSLVGKSASGNWYAGFKATELPVLVLNKPTYLNTVSMNSFMMSVTYRYDRFPKSKFPYDMYLP